MIGRSKIIKVKLEALCNEWKGLCDIDKDAHAAISSDEGDGKSVKNDTEIIYLTDRGLMKDSIENLYNKKLKEIYTFSLNKKTYKIEKKRINKIIRHTDNRGLIKIKTRSGNIIEATKDHSFLTYHNGRIVETKGNDLKIKDFIPTISRIHLTKKDIINKEKTKYIPNKHASNIKNKINSFKYTFDLGFICGAYLSEGHLGWKYSKTARSRITITNQDKFFIGKLKKSLMKYNIKILEKKDYRNDIYNSYLSVFLEQFGMGSENKKIPIHIFYANKEFIKGLLSGYWSGDGSINYKGKFGKRQSIYYDLSFTTKSKDLAFGIRLLMNRLGIVTTLRTRKVKGYDNIYYVCRIVNGDISEFRKQIKIFHKKKTALNKICQKRKKSFDFIKYMPMDKEKLRGLSNKLHYRRDETKSKDIIGNLFTNIERCGGIGFCNFKKHDWLFKNNEPYSKELMKIYNGDVYWDRIISIEENEYDDYVYDLSVEDNENFILGNGSLVHNTTLGMHIIKKHLDGNLWDNVVYSKNPREFYDKYEGLPRKSGMLFDEALDLLDRINWAKFGLRGLVKKFRGSVRKEKNMIFLYNVQLFRDLHGYWRNHRIRYWLEITPREWFHDVNFCYIMKRQRVPFITGKRDCWLLDDSEKQWMKKMKGGVLTGEKYISMLRSHPFYRGEFKFENLPTNMYNEYIKRRIEAKNTYEKDQLFEDIPRRLLHREAIISKLVNKLRLEFEMKQGDIAKDLGITDSRLSEMCSRGKESDNE